MHCHSVDGGSSKVARRAQDAVTIASRFKSCDIVWVKMLSSPWWPGTLFDRTWMSDEDQSKKKAGTVCIRFFGTYEVCHLVPDPGNLHPYSDFPDFDAPPFESWRRGDKIQEKRQQEAEKYKRALLEASLLFKEACNGDKNIVPIFWGVTREQDLCQICGSVEDPLGSLLLCDQCDTPWHMECLRPPLIRVPDGDWFCPDCAGRVTRRTAVLDELYSMRDDMGSAKRGRGSREVLPVADDAPQDVVGSSVKEKRPRSSKKIKNVEVLAAHTDFNVLFAASQKYRPLPCAHEAPPADASGSCAAVRARSPPHAG